MTARLPGRAPGPEGAGGGTSLAGECTNAAVVIDRTTCCCRTQIDESGAGRRATHVAGAPALGSTARAGHAASTPKPVRAASTAGAGEPEDVGEPMRGGRTCAR
ncbi:hypothetical protein [Streptomyces marincola]|uniref:Uncharacterized protein n=1 Tax=Streptomyces marincola TaxID=2878388 RepID=A0A1W7D1I1_9ACTN|nr:hypothetical protein [Streptomyces marincola]ARQ70807.1 hypothetical protein CAG99_19945 [Streptomyces marincola]